MKEFLRFIGRIILLLWQWLLAVFTLLICAIIAADAMKKWTVGLDTTAYFAAIAATALVAFLLSPPLFFRFPVMARVGSYALLPLVVVGLALTGNAVDEAYERTPQGARETKAAAAAKAAELEFERRERQEQARLYQENQFKAVIKKEADAVWQSIQSSYAGCIENTEKVAQAAKSRDEYELYVAAQAAQRACEDSSAKIETIAPPPSALGETRAKYVSAIGSCSTAFGMTAISYRTLAQVIDGNERAFEFRKWMEQSKQAIDSCKTDFDNVAERYELR